MNDEIKEQMRERARVFRHQGDSLDPEGVSAKETCIELSMRILAAINLLDEDDPEWGWKALRHILNLYDEQD